MEESKKGVPARFAGFWIRLLAYIIDFLVLGIVYWVLNGIFWAFTFPFWGWGDGWGWPLIPFWTMGFPWWVIAAAYFIVFWALRGETLGMMALRLRVVHADGTRLRGDWGAALIRFVGYFICWITAGLLFLWIAFDGRKQGIHDKLADTYVVILPPRQAVLLEAEEGHVE